MKNTTHYSPTLGSQIADGALKVAIGATSLLGLLLVAKIVRLLIACDAGQLAFEALVDAAAFLLS